MRLSCDPTAAWFVFTCLFLCAAVIRAGEPDPRKRLEKRVFRLFSLRDLGEKRVT